MDEPVKYPWSHYVFGTDEFMTFYSYGDTSLVDLREHWTLDNHNYNQILIVRIIDGTEIFHVIKIPPGYYCTPLTIDSIAVTSTMGDTIVFDIKGQEFTYSREYRGFVELEGYYPPSTVRNFSKKGQLILVRCVEQGNKGKLYLYNVATRRISKHNVPYDIFNVLCLNVFIPRINEYFREHYSMAVMRSIGILPTELKFLS